MSFFVGPQTPPLQASLFILLTGSQEGLKIRWGRVVMWWAKVYSAPPPVEIGLADLHKSEQRLLVTPSLHAHNSKIPRTHVHTSYISKGGWYTYLPRRGTEVCTLCNSRDARKLHIGTIIFFFLTSRPLTKIEIFTHIYFTQFANLLVA